MNHESKRVSFSPLRMLILLVSSALALSLLSGVGSAAVRTAESTAQGRDEGARGEEQVPEYVLGPGDRFHVRVWGYDELEQEVFIPPSGVAILYPIGEVKASGLTTSELDEVITKGLTRYVKQQPEVTVVPMTYVHSNVYVLGEVGNPGLYPFTGKMTVLDAVTRAGNPSGRAAIQQVTITRPDPDNSEKAKIIVVDLDSVIHKGEAGNDIDLRPGDIVYVPDVISAAQRSKGAARGTDSSREQ